MRELYYHSYRQDCISRLKKGGICNAVQEFDQMAEALAGITRLQAIQESALSISREIADQIDLCIEKRVAGHPLQYLLGTCRFMDLPYMVRPGVLIPRFDTEILVLNAISEIKEKPAAVLDLCTGSGCIGISILQACPNATCVLSDISPEALSVCKMNIEAHNLSARGKIIQSDLFSAFGTQKFDYIVSNPPYIKADVIETLATDVKDHEPRLALDGGQDGLTFYREITKHAPDYLHPQGMLFLEIGYNQREEVCALLEEHFTDIQYKYDYGGNPRVIIARRK